MGSVSSKLINRGIILGPWNQYFDIISQRAAYRIFTGTQGRLRLKADGPLFTSSPFHVKRHMISHIPRKPLMDYTSLNPAIHPGYHLKAQIAITFTPNLPPEIWEKIFDFVLETGKSRLSLALVCKRWKQIIFEFPRLWRRISLRMKYNASLNYTSAMLHARIIRTGSIGLEVVLDANWPSKPNHGGVYDPCATAYEQLHEELVKSIHRWVSLTIPNLSKSEAKKDQDQTQAPLPNIRTTHIVPHRIFSSTQKMERLRHLHIEHIGSYVHLWPLIVQVSPNIQHLQLDSDWSNWSAVSGTSLNYSYIKAMDLHCQSLVTFKGGSTDLRNLTELRSTSTMSIVRKLREVNLTGSTIRDAFLFPSQDIKQIHAFHSHRETQPCIFPFLTVFVTPSGAASDIRVLHDTSIQHLIVTAKIIDDGIKRGIPISVTCLTTLSLHDGPLTAITQLDAPQLHTLIIGNPVISRFQSDSRLEESEEATILFRDLGRMVHITPKTFHLHYPLSADTVYWVLEKWFNIEDLLLAVNEEFPWRERLELFQAIRTPRKSRYTQSFPNLLLPLGTLNPPNLTSGEVDRARGEEGSPTWIVCPNLRTLRLKTNWKLEESQEWREMAKQILEARNSKLEVKSLHSIFWTCNSETWNHV